MKKQMIWGFTTLILLLGIAAVFIFLDQNAELRQLEQETADSTKQLEERNNPQVVDVSDPQRQPPPGETHQTGYWDSDKWKPKTESSPQQQTPAGLKALSSAEFNALPGEVRDEAYQQWREQYKERMGVEAAPLGEHYNHAIDDEGNIYRVYPNTVTFFKPKKMKIGYAPTLEQHNQMRTLHTKWHEAQDAGNTAEVSRLEAEMETLKAAAQGEIPTLGASVYNSVGESPEERLRNKRQQKDAALRQAYIDLNLEHIMPASLK